MALHTEAMPDNPNRIAFLHGPLVLAGKLSEKTTGAIDDTAILVADKNQLRQSVQHKIKNLFLPLPVLRNQWILTLFLSIKLQVKGKLFILIFILYNSGSKQKLKLSQSSFGRQQ